MAQRSSAFAQHVLLAGLSFAPTATPVLTFVPSQFTDPALLARVAANPLINVVARAASGESPNDQGASL